MRTLSRVGLLYAFIVDTVSSTISPIVYCGVLIHTCHTCIGVIKTHHLLLSDPTNDSAPVIPDNDDESKIVVQARAVKQILDLFPSAHGAKSDAELVWRFDENEVKIKNVEKGGDGKSVFLYNEYVC